MLVYFDPWLAGVVLPGLIIVGLICIPYIDKNPKGNGYYTFNERKAEITIFLFGFVVLWCSLIVLGTFLRGPNWNFFGPFEFWDIHKLAALTNVNLSEYIWVRALRHGPADALVRARDLRHPARAVLRVRAAGDSGEDVVQGATTRSWARRATTSAVFLFLMMMSLPIKMLRAVALQPEVHRGDSGILLQHLNHG